MATVTDGDRECFTALLAEQKRALWAPGGRENPDEAAAGAIATHREASVREALDRQARRVFAALCDRCADKQQVVLASGDGWSAEWVHPEGDYHHGCQANLARFVADPDGRLAKPEA
jgi:hypothetical protein